MGLGQFLVIIVLIIGVVYLVSPVTFYQGVSYVENLLHVNIITIPPQYNSTNNTNQNNSTNNSTIACTPNCNNKLCGDDGCSGSCGTCGNGKTCNSGTCVNIGNTCTPICNGKCGGAPDTCGGYCNAACTSNLDCSNQANWGQCTNVWSSCSTYSNILTNQLKREDCCTVSGNLVDTNLYCNNPTFIKGSSYGVIRVYLASSPDTGWDLNKLQQIASDWKTKINVASSGVVDNLKFYYDPENPDFSKPNVDMQTMSIAYYFSSDCNTPYWSANTFSFAYMPQSGKIPSGTTCPMAPYISGVADLWHDTLHEFGHTLGCDDYDGDMMRPIPLLTDNSVYPPICLEEIQNNIKNGITRIFPN